MFVADAHADTLYALAIHGQTFDETMITPERLRAGGVGLQTFALFAGTEGPAGEPYQKGQAMLKAAESLGVPLWKGALPDSPPEAPTGILSIEGGEMLEGSAERLREFAREGVRMIALTWNCENELAYPAAGDSGRGLKRCGLAILREMDRLGILADASHLNERGFYEAAEHSSLPIIASHSNCQWLCDVPRNLTRGQVRTIIQKNGFIGINFYPRFLKAEGPADTDDILRHIDAVAELGGVSNLGFGSDFDGIETTPADLTDPAGFPALLRKLLDRGYTQSQVEGIAGKNLWRVLKEAERSKQV